MNNNTINKFESFSKKPSSAEGKYFTFEKQKYRGLKYEPLY